MEEDTDKDANDALQDLVCVAHDFACYAGGDVYGEGDATTVEHAHELRFLVCVRT